MYAWDAADLELIRLDVLYYTECRVRVEYRLTYKNKGMFLYNKRSVSIDAVVKIVFIQR